jgi:L-threonine kinase
MSALPAIGGTGIHQRATWPASLTVVAQARATVPATCGELLQGVDVLGPLLVSLPIAVSGTVDVALVREDIVRIEPPAASNHAPLRAEAALRLALDRLDWRGGAVARLGAEIPTGRGMGSSTVDVAGIIGATFAAAGRALEPAELLTLASAVEPSDSSALPGLWAIDHVAASRAVPLGAAAADWHVVAVDSDTPVDTLALHARSGPGPRIPDDTLAQLRSADPRALARLATASALRNQQRLRHPAFAALQEVVATTNALGICVAHSGSVCAAICAGVDSARRSAAAVRALGLSCVTWRVAAPGMHVEVRRPAP